MSRTFDSRITTPVAEARRPLKLNYGCEDNCENIDPVGYTPMKKPPPLTPIQNTMYNMRKKLEEKLSGDLPVDVEDRTSPGLARLRQTPGKGLRERQKILEIKHQEAKNKIYKLNTGGGVSLWPQMTSMRLTSDEVVKLVCASLGLLVATVVVFYQLHGSLVKDLYGMTQKLKELPRSNVLVYADNSSFQASIITWHRAMTTIMNEVHSRFDVKLSRTPVLYKVCVLLYVAGIVTLLYYLVDNILSKSKLSPKRIKSWVCLLAVLGTWTILMLHLLACAKALEDSVTHAVHQFNMEMGELIYLNLDLTKYKEVREFWVMRCLPPTSRGTLAVLGLVPVQDIMYYLQYYSLPVITALLTPVIKLLLALKEVYAIKRV